MIEPELDTLLAPERLKALEEESLRATHEDVRKALSLNNLGLQGFLALLSPAAEEFAEEIAQRAYRLTRERFGRVVNLYAPLYLSNECTNACVYCGFNRGNEFRRVTLSPEEIAAEAEAIWTLGFRNVLLVSGESRAHAPVTYLAEAVGIVRERFPAVSIEVYPLETEEYALLADAGVEGVTIYQETYDPALYAEVHPSGRKRDFAWRLATPARAGAAGMRRVGIGALLGLGRWRFEAIALALHADWLQRKYWRTAVSISFPRLRSAAGGFAPKNPVSDRDMARMAMALRLLHPDAGLVLSTREAQNFRDGLAPICVTMMSAGSRTEPGGYGKPGEAGEQFAIEDRRTPAEVAQMLLSAGLEPVWKDWDRAFGE